jgi:hypothetical protein
MRVKTKDYTKNVFDALKSFEHEILYVGVTEETSERAAINNNGILATNSINNAQLLLLLTNGSPINNTPNNDFFEQGIKDATKSNIGIITENLEQALQHPEHIGNLHSMWSEIGENTVQAIQADCPVDTGQLRASITYIIEEN